MCHERLLDRAAALFTAMAAIFLMAIAASAQQPAALTPSNEAAVRTDAKCTVAADQARFEQPLTRVAFRLAGGLPIKVVAIGSSSTAGAGASAPSASYPSRLAIELGRHFPGHDLTVLNRGVNGEEAADMLARFDTEVIAERPHLVLWQLGTNSLLRDRPIDPGARPLHKGIARLKAMRADVVLIDPQFAPRVIAKPNTEAMVALLAAVAKEEKVDVFRRFAMMRRWQEADGLPFQTFVSPDGLHMNDWSYACFAKWLGVAIAEAANRPTATAAAPRAR
jgi:acyl-CoA thioesterase I